MIITQEGYVPLPGDVYSPDEPNFGNSNFGKENVDVKYKTTFNWDLSTWATTDIRLFYTGRYRTAYS
jgi:hypothetical protein